MNIHEFSNLRVSSLHLQQGLFASLALSVTLIGGQQLGRLEQAPQPVVAAQHYIAPQQHFKAFGPVSDTTGRYELAARTKPKSPARNQHLNVGCFKCSQP